MRFRNLLPLEVVRARFGSDSLLLLKPRMRCAVSPLGVVCVRYGSDLLPPPPLEVVLPKLK